MWIIASPVAFYEVILSLGIATPGNRDLVTAGYWLLAADRLYFSPIPNYPDYVATFKYDSRFRIQHAVIPSFDAYNKAVSPFADTGFSY